MKYVTLLLRLNNAKLVTVVFQEKHFMTFFVFLLLMNLSWIIKLTAYAYGPTPIVNLITLFVTNVLVTKKDKKIHIFTPYLITLYKYSNHF